MFPLNIILDTSEEQNWQNSYFAYHNYKPEVIKEFTELFSKGNQSDTAVPDAGYTLG